MLEFYVWDDGTIMEKVPIATVKGCTRIDGTTTLDEILEHEYAEDILNFILGET